MTAKLAISRRRAALYGMAASYASTGFGILTGLVLVPLYLRHFGLDTYGAWLASGGVVTMLTLLDGGLTQVLTQRLGTCAGANDSPGFARVWGSGACLGLGVCTLVAALGIILAPWVPQWVGAKAADLAALQHAFAVASVGVGCNLISQYLSAYTYAWQCTGVMSLCTLAGLLAGVGVTVFGLWAEWGVVALAAATLARALVHSVLLGVHVVADWRRRAIPLPQCCVPELIQQLRLTGPLFLGRSGAVVLSNSEAVLVASFLGPGVAAMLVLTGKTFQVAQTLVNPLAGGCNAGITHLAASAAAARLRTVVGELLELSAVAAALLLGCALTFNEVFVRLWVGPQAFAGLLLSFVLCVSAALTIRMNLISTVLLALGVIERPALLSLCEVPLKLALLWLLTPRLGAVGIPLAGMVSTMALSGWLFPRLLAKRLSLPQHMGITLMLRGCGFATALLALASIFALGLHHGGTNLLPTWQNFMAAAVVLGSLFLTLVFCGSAAARRLAQMAWDQALAANRLPLLGGTSRRLRHR